MAWTTPQYSRRQVNEAGRIYVDPSSTNAQREISRIVIDNWRSSHSFPLNTIQVNLRNSARRIDSDPTVAQRIKRLPSIQHKLERIPGMKLARMQDLGGCRAVMESVGSVSDLVRYFTLESQMRHRLLRTDLYVVEPPPSGYRGVHLVYAYESDRKTTYNGLRIEVQVRSRLQHAWATAVEIVDLFTKQMLKSSQGKKDWLRFFALMGSSMAVAEGTPLVPGTPQDIKELRAELSVLADKLKAVERLQAYGAALQSAEEDSTGKGQTYILELDVDQRALTIRRREKAALAASEYSALERSVEGDPSKDVVLVKVDDLTSLRKAYPNYFLDTHEFVESLQAAIAE